MQASKYVEGTFKYDNREAYVQDNWKVKSNWSIDYGVRFVHAVPQHDALLQSGNFLPDKWVQSAAPVLYVPGCVGNTAPCAGSNRSAKNPLTGQLLGPNTSLAIGTLVPNSGTERNACSSRGKRSRTRHTSSKAEYRAALRHRLRHIRHPAPSCADPSASTSTGRAA